MATTTTNGPTADQDELIKQLLAHQASQGIGTAQPPPSVKGELKEKTATSAPVDMTRAKADPLNRQAAKMMKDMSSKRESPAMAPERQLEEKLAMADAVRPGAMEVKKRPQDPLAKKSSSPKPSADVKDRHNPAKDPMESKLAANASTKERSHPRSNTDILIQDASEELERMPSSSASRASNRVSVPGAHAVEGIGGPSPNPTSLEFGVTEGTVDEESQESHHGLAEAKPVVDEHHPAIISHAEELDPDTKTSKKLEQERQKQSFLLLGLLFLFALIAIVVGFTVGR